MTLHCLQALTWGTVSAAVVSALLLASGEPRFPEPRARDGAPKPFAKRPPVDAAPQDAAAAHTPVRHVVRATPAGAR